MSKVEKKSSSSAAGEETPLIDKHFRPQTAGKPGYESASKWSQLLFSWMVPLLLKGKEKYQLDPSDLKDTPLPIDCTTNQVLERFDLFWENEKKRAKDRASLTEGIIDAVDPQPSLALALSKAFGGGFIRAGVLKLCHDLLIFVGPLVLKGLIDFLKDNNAPWTDGAFLTLAVTISQTLMSLFLRHYFYQCYLTGLRVRTAIVAAVYRKALLLAASERYSRTTGEITNLVAVDAQRLQDLTTYLHALWYSFVQIFLSLWLLWNLLGPSCLGGFAVILLIIPLTKIVAQWMGEKQKHLMVAKDGRVEINNEVLGSMKVIKIQAWEEPFQKKIEDLRNKELHELMAYFVAKAISTLIYASVPLLVSLATFSIYVLLGNTLEVSSALTALALFEILRFPLFMFPQVMNSIVEATVALHRVSSFLVCQEHEPITTGDLSDVGIRISNASFVYESKKPKASKKGKGSLEQKILDAEWEITLLRSQLEDAEMQLSKINFSTDEEIPADKQSSSFQNLLCLRRVNLECERGAMIAVVGTVGSGKTSLINAILGEVRAIAGTVFVKGRVAYFAQTPFIMNNTLKENILFRSGDEPYDENAYKEAISVCALEQDLSILPGGDACEIGEKGITLSGGQKARIAMARVVYHDADICLLDDPLAAVDAHVGKHLFQNCIIDKILMGGGSRIDDKSNYRGKKKKVVVLVTNALQYLRSPMVDRILVVGDGTVQESGTYSELSMNPASLFSKSLKSFHESQDEQNLHSKEHEDLIPNASSSSSLNAMGIIGADADVAKIVAPFDDNKQLRSSARLPAPTEVSDSNSGVLTTDELQERDIGHVTLSVYLSWAKAAGGSAILFLIVFSYSAVEAINVLSRWWLTHWSFYGSKNGNQLYYLFVYAAINLSAVVATFFRLLFITMCGLRAARMIFSRLLDAVLRAPMSFFDATPIGRIVNRFSKDMYTVDEQLVATMMSYLATMASVISVVVVISVATPLFLAFLLPLFVFYASEQNFFTKSYRELKRLDSVARSPLYSTLGETLDGIATIRAFSMSHVLMNKYFDFLDKQQNAYFLTFAGQCWLAVRLEFLGTAIIAFACSLAVFGRNSMSSSEEYAGLAGLSISYALSVTQALNWTVRMGSDLEANMIALERIEQYCRLEPEANRSTSKDVETSSWWPRQGEIVFKNAMLRYRRGLPLVLKGLDITIPAQSKVGVVGRTGAGKSSLMVALLRIVELDSGCILIDEKDIKTVGLSLLRRKIATIPQDPTLFSGTIRTNLDPFHEFTDDRLSEVLFRVGLFGNSRSTIAGKNQATYPLDSEVLEGGSNFSVGQRQLIVIARALLRQANIVILDEATASVDSETDARIQSVMRTEFKRATCITVAHRINTIMDSTYILVMDNGKVAEFDSPASLLSKESLFKELVDAWEKEHK